MRYLLSWILYGLGSAAFWLIEISGVFYHVYKWLMLASCDIQRKGSGPWSKPE